MRYLSFSLSALLLASLTALGPVGCSKKEKGQVAKGDDKKDAKKDSKKDDHGHAHEGPNGGALAEWGEEKFHAEFTVDHDKKQATVYILDGSAKKYSPIAAESVMLTISNLKPPIQVILKSDPQKDDSKGRSSRFTGTHEKLATVMEFKGEISGTVDGTPYAGTFAEESHDHKHEKKK